MLRFRVDPAIGIMIRDVILRLHMPVKWDFMQVFKPVVGLKLICDEQIYAGHIQRATDLNYSSVHLRKPINHAVDTP